MLVSRQLPYQNLELLWVILNLVYLHLHFTLPASRVSLPWLRHKLRPFPVAALMFR